MSYQALNSRGRTLSKVGLYLGEAEIPSRRRPMFQTNVAAGPFYIVGIASVDLSIRLLQIAAGVFEEHFESRSGM